MQESSQTVTPAAPAPSSTKQRSLFASSMLSSLAQKAEVITQQAESLVHLKESTNVTAAVGILSLHSAFPVVSADNTTTPAGPILKDLPLHTLRRSPMA